MSRKWAVVLLGHEMPEREIARFTGEGDAYAYAMEILSRDIGTTNVWLHPKSEVYRRMYKKQAS